MTNLEGRRILVAEDKFFIATELRQELEKNGAEILGPSASIDAALRLSRTADSLDAALLDIDLGGEMAYPVADALLERNVPFIFISGFGRQGLSEKYADTPLLDKPIVMHRLHAFLSGLFA